MRPRRPSWTISRDQAANFVGPARGGVQVATRQHQDELFAAVAPSHVVQPEVRLQPAGHFRQHRIARGMAQGVVNLLEDVHIGHDDSGRPAFPLGADQLALERSQNFRAAQQVGQEIGGGGKPETLLQVENPFARQDARARNSQGSTGLAR